MKSRAFHIASLFVLLSLAPWASAQEENEGAVMEEQDGSGLTRELQERQEKINQLSTEERAAVDAARKTALDDPAVKAALAARNEAAENFRAALQASMLKSDPSMRQIFEKATAGARARRR